jgi:hypothetical protein
MWNPFEFNAMFLYIGLRCSICHTDARAIAQKLILDGKLNILSYIENIALPPIASIACTNTGLNIHINIILQCL